MNLGNIAALRFGSVVSSGHSAAGSAADKQPATFIASLSAPSWSLLADAIRLSAAVNPKKRPSPPFFQVNFPTDSVTPVHVCGARGRTGAAMPMEVTGLAWISCAWEAECATDVPAATAEDCCSARPQAARSDLQGEISASS